MITLHTDQSSIPPDAEGCVLLIGNFDGVHLGHRALIKAAQEISAKEQAPLGVLTFEPHPQQFFYPDAAPFRLTLLPMKGRLLGEMGVDHLFAWGFNQVFSQLDADAFIDRILIQKLKVRHVVVGADFSFGRGRTGTVETLKNRQFELTVVPTVASPEGQVYSSTAIRALLRQGKFSEAQNLLGWPWQTEALIVHGDKRGRALGYPTTNQDMGAQVRIPYGVYAVEVLIEDEKEKNGSGRAMWRTGVASFGIRPMFLRPQPVFETFIFDFDDDVYGKMMRVRPVHYLRPELSFSNLPMLIRQMKVDCLEAKAVLSCPRYCKKDSLMPQASAVGRHFLLGFIIMFAAFLTDQYTKWLVMETVLRIDGPAAGGFFDWFVTQQKVAFFILEQENFRTVAITPLLNFVMVWNRGISFGLMDTDGVSTQLFFIALSMMISLLLIIWLAMASRRIVAAALGLIIGGALANVIDRVRFSAVADFIDVHIGTSHWPAFNLADSCIVIGAGLLMLDALLTKDEQRGKK